MQNSAHHIESSLGTFSENIRPKVRNLEGVFDFDLTFTTIINKVIQSCFFHIRTIGKIKTKLTKSDLEKVIHALIFYRLDYCNPLLPGINQKILSLLQLVQNTAARAFNWF